MKSIGKPSILPALRSSEKALLHLLRLRGALSKAELARLSDMSAQGVSIIVERLLDLDLVRKGQKKRGRVGQPSTPIALNPEGAVSLGIFTGHDASRLLITDFLGSVIADRRIAHEDIEGTSVPQILLENAVSLAATVDPGLWSKRVGIGISARNNSTGSRPTGCLRALTARMEAEFDVPAWCVNDIRAACLAELALGDNQAGRSILYIFMGMALGTGIVVEGRLIGSEEELSSGLHVLPMPGEMEKNVGDFASLGALKISVEKAGYDLGNQISCDFADTQPVFDRWRVSAVEALCLAIRSASATVPLDRVAIASRLGGKLHAEIIDEVRRRIRSEGTDWSVTPEITGQIVQPCPRARGSAMVPFFKLFAPSETGIVPYDRRTAA